MFSRTKRCLSPHNAQYDMTPKLCSTSPQAIVICDLVSILPVLNLQAVQDDDSWVVCLRENRDSGEQGARTQTIESEPKGSQKHGMQISWMHEIVVRKL